jgi:hypothetical protein
MKYKFISFLKNWNVKYVLTIWIVWMTILILVGAIMVGRIPVNGSIHNYYGIGEQLSVWTNWDGNNYVVIAREGYNILPLYAFFPLLPILITIFVNTLDISYPLAGVIVSRLALFGALIFLVKLVEKEWGKDIAYKTAWLMLIFPTAYFLMAVYTESLFLFTTLATWYFAKDRNWWLAGFFGFFAPLTRLLGILVAPVIFWEYLVSKGWNLKKIRFGTLAIFTPLLGLLSYAYFNYIQTGDWLHFLNAQKYWAEVHGRGGYHNPMIIIWDEFISTISKISNEGIFIIGGTDLWMTLFAVGILIWITIRKTFSPPYLIWSWGFLMIPIISGSLVSMPRYVLGFFPIYIVLAVWCNKSKLFEQFYTFTSVLLMATFYTMFLFQIWLA